MIRFFERGVRPNERLKKFLGKGCMPRSVFTPAVTVFDPPEGSSNLRWAKFKIFCCPSLSNVKLCVCVYEDNCVIRNWESSWDWRFITTVFWVMTACSPVCGFLSLGVLNCLLRKCEHFFLNTTLWFLATRLVKFRSKFSIFYHVEKCYTASELTHTNML